MLRRIITADGSSTLLHEKLGETYHSTKGARSESIHVYIETGLQFRQQQKPNKPLQILEVGYGTGMNALLTLEHARQPIYYTGLEPFPIQDEEHITCGELFDATLSEAQEKMASLPWTHNTEFQQITEHFFLRKLPLALMDYHAEIMADLVYFDAFAPKYQPDLWQDEAWKHLRRQVNPDALAVTYCAQGAFRRMLKENHWQVEKLPGPPSQKLEMTRVLFAT
jgi:tRNA U34 5-methylaminomethyl-2-thiouridine-forming methyltransferase MnmC